LINQDGYPMLHKDGVSVIPKPEQSAEEGLTTGHAFMERTSAFSYLCNQCARCCHDQVITLSPYDIVRIARGAGISTGEAIEKYTMRRGSLLRFDLSGACIALDGTACTIHDGRTLACRLYPLGMERDEGGAETFVRLQPALGSRGTYGDGATVHDFVGTQQAEEYLCAVRHYAALLRVCRERIAELVDFELVEPREFWRVAVREALAEAGFDHNHLTEVLFDPDGLGCSGSSYRATVEQHVREIEGLIRGERDANALATAAALLAVSLGYSPAEIMPELSSPRRAVR
jgi:Fe-S-cluster containining protein